MGSLPFCASIKRSNNLLEVETITALVAFLPLVLEHLPDLVQVHRPRLQSPVRLTFGTVQLGFLLLQFLPLNEGDPYQVFQFVKLVQGKFVDFLQQSLRHYTIYIFLNNVTHV